MIDALRERLEALRIETERELDRADSPEEAEAIRVRVLGKKGALTREAKAIGGMAAGERPDAGELVNRTKAAIESALELREATLAARALEERLKAEAVDMTLPGRRKGQGTRHPLSIVADELLAIFRRMGFTVATGPEAETLWHNFEALNIPAGHPAREEMDTLYLNPGDAAAAVPGQDDGGAGAGREIALLRTHTSPVQIRSMTASDPPVRVVCPGRVFRSDTPDASHSPYFHQIEGLWVDEGISMAHLKWALTEFVHQFFGAGTSVRFRASYFPFTEPSAELDMQCLLCGGEGCRTCKGTGWLELLGCGMVHPAVLEAVGYDSERWTGFAWGMGIERVAMLRYGIPDIRMFFDNDLRFLHQFGAS